MNFTESFEQFSSRLGPTDLALYAGVGLVVWILFKDKLGPVQSVLSNVVSSVKKLVPSNKTEDVTSVVKTNPVDTDDLFFRLVASWKQTRNLAVQSGCNEAVKVADQMFPFLSPTVCADKKETVL